MAATTKSKAVIETGGKQYLVSPGSVISVEKLDAAVGDTITLGMPVFLYEDGKLASDTALKKAIVQAEVLEQGKGEKIRVFKFKSKKHYRRTQGHRQLFSKLRVTAIAAAAEAK